MSSRAYREWKRTRAAELDQVEDLLWNRQLDTRNATQGTIAADFGRLGIPGFWARVDTIISKNDQRRRWLGELNSWRNAIAHQSFDPGILGGTTLRLRRVQRWRRGCDRLAKSMDRVLRAYIHSVTGSYPW